MASPTASSRASRRLKRASRSSLLPPPARQARAVTETAAPRHRTPSGWASHRSRRITSARASSSYSSRSRTTRPAWQPTRTSTGPTISRPRPGTRVSAGGGGGGGGGRLATQTRDRSGLWARPTHPPSPSPLPTPLPDLAGRNSENKIKRAVLEKQIATLEATLRRPGSLPGPFASAADHMQTAHASKSSRPQQQPPQPQRGKQSQADRSRPQLPLQPLGRSHQQRHAGPPQQRHRKHAPSAQHAAGQGRPSASGTKRTTPHGQAVGGRDEREAQRPRTGDRKKSATAQPGSPTQTPQARASKQRTPPRKGAADETTTAAERSWNMSKFGELGRRIYTRSVRARSDLGGAHLTSPHLTSPNLTLPHLLSPRLTLPHPASSRLARPRPASPRLTSPNLAPPHLTSPLRYPTPHPTLASPVAGRKVDKLLTSPPSGASTVVQGAGSGAADGRKKRRKFQPPAPQAHKKQAVPASGAGKENPEGDRV